MEINKPGHGTQTVGGGEREREGERRNGGRKRRGKEEENPVAEEREEERSVGVAGRRKMTLRLLAVPRLRLLARERAGLLTMSGGSFPPHPPQPPTTLPLSLIHSLTHTHL